MTNTTTAGSRPPSLNFVKVSSADTVGQLASGNYNGAPAARPTQPSHPSRTTQLGHASMAAEPDHLSGAEEVETIMRVVRPLGTGLGISIAGGLGATPYRGGDQVIVVVVVVTVVVVVVVVAQAFL